MTRKTDKQDPIRKIAILVSSLDQQATDDLLDRLPSDQARAVRNVLVDMDDVPQDEQTRIASEFLRSGSFHPPAEDSGIELDDALAEKLASPNGYADHLEVAPEPVGPPFRFLREAATDAIAKHLVHENPQVAAIVAAHLSPDQAANLIAHFTSEQQADILRRIAALDLTDTGAVRDVEQHLEVLLTEEIRVAKNREVGLSAVASILAAAGGKRETLVRSLSDHDSRLVSQLGASGDDFTAAMRTPHVTSFPAPKRPLKSVATRQSVAKQKPRTENQTKRTPRHDQPSRAFLFNELAEFSDAALARIFRASDPKLALLALTGAAPKFVDRLLSQLPRREAHSLRRRMEGLGPLQLQDVAHAQTKLAALAAELADQGEIDIPVPKRFAVAA